MIVDDDVDFSKKLGKALEKNGFETIILASGAGVIGLLKEKPVEVVILDVMLPRTSGFEICRQIRIDREIYHKGIILLSVMGEREEIEHGYAQGCDDYISKPINFPAFLTRLRAIVALVENEKLIEPVTTLGSARYIRLEILRGMLLKEKFDLAYIELLGLIGLQREIGNESSVKLLRMFSHHLKSLASNFLGKDYYLAHLGGGHFIAKLRSDSLQDFIRELKKSWEDTVERSEMFSWLGTERGRGVSGSNFNVIGCGFTYYPGRVENISRVLERLRSLYSKCKEISSDGILIDRRVK